MAERPISEDTTDLEAVIKQVQARARVVHHRTMRETEDGEHKSALALMELCVRSLSQANDAARYARHNFGRREYGD